MPYTLYGFPRAGSCIVELALAQIGADYEFKGFYLKTDGSETWGTRRSIRSVSFPPSFFRMATS